MPPKGSGAKPYAGVLHTFGDLQILSLGKVNTDKAFLVDGQVRDRSCPVVRVPAIFAEHSLD